MLNFFAFVGLPNGRIDGALKVQISDDLSARGTVAWGRCRASDCRARNYPAGYKGALRT